MQDGTEGTAPQGRKAALRSKAGGDAPVLAYVAAMPDWKGDVGRQLDAVIVRTVPGVQKQSNATFYMPRGSRLVSGAMGYPPTGRFATFTRSKALERFRQGRSSRNRTAATGPRSR